MRCRVMGTLQKGRYQPESGFKLSLEWQLYNFAAGS